MVGPAYPSLKNFRAKSCQEVQLTAAFFVCAGVVFFPFPCFWRIFQFFYLTL